MKCCSQPPTLVRTSTSYSGRIQDSRILGVNQLNEGAGHKRGGAWAGTHNCVPCAVSRGPEHQWVIVWWPIFGKFNYE